MIVIADTKTRVSLSRWSKPGKAFEVAEDSGGRIVLTPLVPKAGDRLPVSRLYRRRLTTDWEPPRMPDEPVRNTRLV